MRKGWPLLLAEEQQVDLLVPGQVRLGGKSGSRGLQPQNQGVKTFPALLNKLSINPKHVFLIFPKNMKDDQHHLLSGNFSAV